MNDFQLVEKEEVSSLHFPKNDVLLERDAIVQRTVDLQRAQALGNLEHGKIKIYFEDDACKKMVETTVWGFTDQEVILKQGMIIPVNRVYKIN
jgi:Flp pilus assembly CpaE family ATPase